MNGGASVFFIFLVGVLVVLGAGYLLNQSNQDAIAIAANGQVQATLAYQSATSEALAKTAQAERDTLATQLAASEAERSRLATAAASAEAERSTSAIAQATAVADRNAKEAERVAMEKERNEAVVAKATVEAQRNAAVDALAAANAEIERQRAEIMKTPVIPVVGGDSAERTNSKTSPTSSMQWVGFALFGVVVFAGAFGFGRISKPAAKAQYAKDVTTVVMSVDEARRYARSKAQRKS